MSEHRAVGGAEQDVSKSLLHGYCKICVTPWPCETELMEHPVMAYKQKIDFIRGHIEHLQKQLTKHGHAREQNDCEERGKDGYLVCTCGLDEIQKTIENIYKLTEAV